MNELSGEKLDRAIAELLGYSVRWDEQQKAAILTLRGEEFGSNRTWADVPKESLIDGAWNMIPNGKFSKDANSTLEACADLGWFPRFEIDDSDPKAVEYVVWIETDDPPEYDGRSSHNWQEAFARALRNALENS